MSEDTNARHVELSSWLAERGHSPEEIAKILDEVDRYDADTISGSIFDSIDSGDFNIDAVIKAALGDRQ